MAASLRKRGLRVRAGAEPRDGILVAAADRAAGVDEPAAAGTRDSDAHLAVIAGTNEASDDMDHWVQALDLPIESEQETIQP